MKQIRYVGSCDCHIQMSHAYTMVIYTKGGWGEVFLNLEGTNVLHRHDFIELF